MPIAPAVPVTSSSCQYAEGTKMCALCPSNGFNRSIRLCELAQQYPSWSLL
jgi:hypothetical protein